MRDEFHWFCQAWNYINLVLHLNPPLILTTYYFVVFHDFLINSRLFILLIQGVQVQITTYSTVFPDFHQTWGVTETRPFQSYKFVLMLELHFVWRFTKCKPLNFWSSFCLLWFSKFGAQRGARIYLVSKNFGEHFLWKPLPCL